MSMTLEKESERATDILSGKVLARLVRHRESEVLIEFTDGTRLFVDASTDGLELSIQEGRK
jgi:hypothetical protein